MDGFSANINVGELECIRVNFMVAGTGGIGKSTFLDLLFRTYQKSSMMHEPTLDISKSFQRTVSIKEVNDFILKTTNVNVHCHLVDTPGYGDSINNQNAINDIKVYLEDAHRRWTTLDVRTMTKQVRTLIASEIS